ncbi:prolactin-like [Nannospalax galili]|uniref:prolactin-like n=1 Tax=Nannospalax galili TaxID=1026970 RepID=UPI000819A9C3|nr:prolactin-like [Nannospalax galili]
MQLSSGQPCFSGALLLLLSTLWLWKNVTSAPECHSKDASCEVSLQELFDSAISQSKKIRDLSTTMWYIFLTRSYNSQRFQERTTKAMNDCHGSFLENPDTEKEVKEIQSDVLLNVTLRMVGAWNTALQHLTKEMGGVLSIPPALSIFSLAKEIQEKNQELLDDIYRIQRKVYPGFQEDKNYPVWSELASLQSTEENSRFLAAYNLVECLYFDMYDIKDNLNLLRCLIIPNNNC